MSKKIAVIGGGASGLVAAISAARAGAFVTIYEKNSRLGKKILSTGNGRCNLSNKNADISRYHGHDTSFMTDIINSFWVDETLDFFSELGLITRTEADGKIYPYSNQASAVLDVLRFEAERLSIPIVYDFEASKLVRTKGGYTFSSFDGRQDFANSVILATGGKAAPDTGSCGSGYSLAKMMGHNVTKTFPSLVQIKTKGNFSKSLKGIKTDALVSIGNTEYFGELLFTDYGISGPPVFSLSSYLSTEDTVLIDFMPDYLKEDIYAILKKRTSLSVNLENYFVGMLNKRLGMALLKASGISPLSREASSLTDSELSCLTDSIKSFSLDIDGTLSWNNAQVTKGGVEVLGINPKTMESLYNEGLYFCGELTDIDGDCGGFNLQWAWSSGITAGKCCAEKILKQGEL